MIVRLLTAAVCSLLLFTSVNPSSAAETSRLVLVTSSEIATLQQFTPAQLRKLFLGLTVNDHEGDAIHPLRNMSDERLYSVFLQKVVFMSARNYERHLLSRVISMGGRRPPSYTSQTDLIQALHSTPHSVSYMWENRARNTPGIETLQKLW